ncbi:GNAT family N-acetyltransferase [Loktanella sp. S4079]|uniref:GNAT family N-acetyltransferase n=1 Tax=Loktanella sp. S4079 TaxID=579483 RepID=UPI0005FA238F|nr:GNAT family N-acetyltransferase [Loktanella sp. S4079]KJZ20818.1 alanine acetyltransferase [Loktanella sp. S4079]
MTPETLAEIHAAAFPDTRSWSAQEFSKLLAQQGAILSGDDRSFVLLRVTLDEAEVLTVATAPSFRRNGLAAAALEKAEETAQKSGATQVFLEVAEDNEPAKALYARAGYTQVGRRPNYYLLKEGAAVAALVLQKQLVRA